MQRKKPYYYINNLGQIKPTVDNGSNEDKARYLIGNYFTDESKAREKQKAFYTLLGFNAHLLNRIKLDKYLKK